MQRRDVPPLTSHEPQKLSQFITIDLQNQIWGGEIKARCFAAELTARLQQSRDTIAVSVEFRAKGLVYSSGLGEEFSGESYARGVGEDEVVDLDAQLEGQGEDGCGSRGIVNLGRTGLLDPVAVRL